MNENEITSVFQSQVVSRAKHSEHKYPPQQGASWCHVSLTLTGLPVPLTLIIKGTDISDVTSKAIDKMCRLSGKHLRAKVERSDVRWGWIVTFHEPPDETTDLRDSSPLETRTEQAS